MVFIDVRIPWKAESPRTLRVGGGVDGGKGYSKKAISLVRIPIEKSVGGK